MLKRPRDAPVAPTVTRKAVTNSTTNSAVISSMRPKAMERGAAPTRHAVGGANSHGGTASSAEYAAKGIGAGSSTEDITAGAAATQAAAGRGSSSTTASRASDAFVPSVRGLLLEDQVEKLREVLDCDQRRLDGHRETKQQLQAVVETALDNAALIKERVTKNAQNALAAGQSSVLQLRMSIESAKQRARDAAESTAQVEDVTELIKASILRGEASVQEEAAISDDLKGNLTSVCERHNAAQEEVQQAEKDLFEIEHTTNGLSTEVASLIHKIALHKSNVARLENEAMETEIERRRLFGQYEDLKGTIRVYCRVRGGGPNTAKFTFDTRDPRNIEILQTRDNATSTGRKDSNFPFTFDRVFSPTSRQSEVFDEVCPLVDCAVDGYKVCIFAYGQTGSGKTHTMEGTLDDGGIIPRAIDQVFQRAADLAKDHWKYTVTCSFVEIYNDALRDLLEPSEAYHRAFFEGSREFANRHEIQHRGKTDTVVTNVKERTVTAPCDVRKCLEIASSNRSVAKTLMNERSSRSHCVFTLRIDGSNDKIRQRSSGVLCLVDLAGSERVNESGAQGQQLKEAIAINKSLMHLGDCINSLGNNSVVAWRNCKLTYMLQNYLSGEGSKILMLVALSDKEEHTNETVNSMRFAAKVNNTHVSTAKKRTLTM